TGNDGLYVVYMRPNTTPAHGGYTYSAQVTIKVPHGEGETRFVVTNLQSAVADTVWAQRSRIDAPAEAPGADYISFELDPQLSALNAIAWQAGEEVKVFTFENSGSYHGPLALLDGCDPFLASNSAGTNPGNQIAILGLGGDNAYIGNYDAQVEQDCATH